MWLEDYVLRSRYMDPQVLRDLELETGSLDPWCRGLWGEGREFATEGCRVSGPGQRLTEKETEAWA